MWFSRTRLIFLVAFGLTYGVIAGAMADGTAVPGLEKLDPALAAKAPDSDLLWYNAELLTVEGKGWTDTKRFFDRFPGKAEGVVRPPVWSLSRHSAGMAIRFMSDTTSIAARWTVSSDRLAMAHMPATGVSGLDLYVKDGSTWRWTGAGRPGSGRTHEAQLAGGIPEGVHEYLLYLPLYNGTDSLEIGIPSEAMLAKGPARAPGHDKPICFYGTSITQGGCASRPGMTYAAILGRRLDCPAMNFGFSGNGKMEPEVGALLAELDAAAYVINCAPNMTPDVIAECAGPLVRQLRTAHPDTPILLVGQCFYQAGYFLPASRNSAVDKNDAVRKAYENLKAAGVGKLSFVDGMALYGDDGEATVDGTHATDLGFMRAADALESALRQALGL